MQALLDAAYIADAVLSVPAGVLAQSWRGSPRQARPGRLLGLANVTVEPLDEPAAKAAGVLCGQADTNDVVDASVVITVRLHRQTVVTTDLNDLRRLDPRIRLVTV